MLEAIGVLPLLGVIYPVTGTIFDEIILKGLSDQLIIVCRLAADDSAEHLDQCVAIS